MEITNQYLDDISNKKVTHKFYKKTVDHAEDMGIHVEGETPKKLLDINRPNEAEKIKQYRLESYQPVTLSLSEKVINTINKIFNPRLWNINYTKQSAEDSLEKYLTEDYPFYRSIMNFITMTFTQKDFSDPNAVIVVIPKSFDIEETERFEPIAEIYPAEQVVDFKEGEFYALSPEKDIIKIYTIDQIVIYKKTVKDNKSIWTLIFEYSHEFGEPTVFRLGGIIKGKKPPYYYESWISGVLPHWNQVVSMTSDLQAAYINHLYMEKWEFAPECDNVDCQDGRVETEIKDGKENKTIWTKCETCLGTGHKAQSPYGIHRINRDSINPDSPIPNPPFGYPTKPVEIVTKVEDRIKAEEKRGLASINMEIVQMVGTDQSGVAKTVDREDLNAFLSRYSRHIFEYVLPNLILFISMWRYGEIDQPEINQPKDFNVLSLNQLSSEYKDATNANVSSNYLMHLEGELIDTKFANNENARLKNNAIIKLNPFPGKSIDDLLTLKNLGEEDWLIFKANHLIELVEIAIEDDKSFLSKSLKDQRGIIDKLAKEKSGFIEDVQLIVPKVEIEE